MSGRKLKRLIKVAKEFNVGISTIVDFLQKKGFDFDSNPNPNTKVAPECYDALMKEYGKDMELKLKKDKIARKAKEAQKETHVDDDVENDDNENVVMIKDTSAIKEEIVSKTETTVKKVETKKITKKQEEPKKEKVLTETKKEKPDTKEAVAKEKPVVETKPEKKPQKEKNVTLETNKPDKKSQKTEKKEPVPVKTKDENVEVTKKSTETSKKVKEEPKKEVVAEKNTTEVKEEKKKQDNTNTEKETEKEDGAPQYPKVIRTIDLDSINQRTRPKRKTKAEKKDERIKKEKEKRLLREKEKAARLKAKEGQNKPVEKEQSKNGKKKESDFVKTKFEKLSGPTVLGRIDLPSDKSENSADKKKGRKKRRKRIAKDGSSIDVRANNTNNNKSKHHNKKGNFRKNQKPEIDDVEIRKTIKENLAKLTSTKSKTGKQDRDAKQRELDKKARAEKEARERENKTIKVTESVTANELAIMMDISITEVIKTCMDLGIAVTINTRLDAETISILVDHFGFRVEFVSIELQEAVAEEPDREEDLEPRDPIVTVMGHVDHGKTSLLDYIRNTNIIAGESGGITQHISAYSVTFDGDRRITFLDTPGHAAFTNMRSRGAQVTDLVIIVIDANDGVMPTTMEVINHAQAAGVPIIFAINKIDQPNANPEKVKEELANKNFLVEEWGGKYQSKDISAKKGTNVDELMEEVFLAAEIMELKANPNKKAVGTVIESALDKGRGYVARVLINGGTLRVGDSIVAGTTYGKVKAIYNERNQRIQSLGPAQPGQILGLNGSPAAGDKLNVMPSDREAREIATKRKVLEEDQKNRTRKHITLEEVGRRLALGNFKELNIIVKGDVDGSIEALSDSLLNLSTEEIQVKIIHKAVGEIVESDVVLANASDAVIIGFQVRPSANARKLAEKEGIDIRLYSIIYDAINEVKDSIKGMLAPITKEEITAVVEVQEVFKISKVGTIAGCMVKEGKITRSAKVRVIRDGVVIYTSTLGSLKRFKDDAKEVGKGLECGLNIDKYNDVKVGDIVEAYEVVEIER